MSEQYTFTFAEVPTSLAALQALPEADLQTPYKSAALALLALLNFENDKDSTFEMLDFLNGPDTLSPFTKQFIAERINGKAYKVRSFFAGTSPENGYTMSTPLTITVCATPYSFPEENWATMYVQSSGADSLRSLKLRKKPSTGQWFVVEIQCLSDVRVPVEEDPWA